MAKIHLLDQKTINKIAAGEVVEHTASCIKELIENSIDAQASTIAIEIKQGGQTYICVQDNGNGIAYDDVPKAILRHATSKITSEDDIWNISTMGFRGEALSSIAAVSKLSILTSEKIPGQTEDTLQEATFLEVAGGDITTYEKTRSLVGTRIEVRDLFYNVPARKRFQKTQEKETQNIISVVTKIALAHPKISFTLVCDGKRELFTRPNHTTLKERIQDVLGKDLLQKLSEINYKKNDIVVTGYIGIPTYNRRNRGLQFLSINHRVVDMPSFAYAIKDSYGTTLEDAQFPVFILNIDIPTAQVDNNVHPQKIHVRVSREDEIKKALQEAVFARLFQTETAPKEILPSVPHQSNTFSSVKHINEPKQVTFSYEPIYEPYTVDKNPNIPAQQLQAFSHAKILFQYEHVLFTEITNTHFFSSKLPKQFLEEGILLINIRALVHLVRSNEVTSSCQAALQSNDQHTLLLVPQFIQLTEIEASRLRQLQSYVQSIGIGIREFGQSSFLVESVSPLFEKIHIEDFIKSLVHETTDIDSYTQKELIEHIAELSIRSTQIDTIDNEQTLHELLDTIFKLPQYMVSPKGENIFSLMTKKELEKRF